MKKLLHFFKLLVEPSGRNRMFMFQPKRYQVLYPDGKYSIPMAYDVAHDYKIIFGGEVVKYEKI